MKKMTPLFMSLLFSGYSYAQVPLFEAQQTNFVQTKNAEAVAQTQFGQPLFKLSTNTSSFFLPVQGNDIEFIKSTASTSSTGNLIWVGKSLDGDEITLIKSAKGISGTIKVDSRIYKLQPNKRAGHNFIELDPANQPDEHAPGYQPSSPSFSVSEQILTEQNYQTALATNAQSNITLLVLYTTTAAQKSADINSLIDLAIVETNQGYQNSGVNAVVSLAHVAQVNYTEATNSATALNRLAAKNDGYMDEAHTLRDQYGADVVILVNDVNGYCGQANAIGANASTAFAMVDYDCATGYYSFGHEIGHLQGARHNPENDPSTSPYAFGHGYQHPQSQWRSVMAYNCNSSCTRINYWSNPNKSYNGAVMGTATQHDNARVLNLTNPTIANFRSGTTTPPPSGNELQNNQPITVNGAKNSEQLFTFTAPSGIQQVTITTSGGTGDLDLYVKYNGAASSNNYDCRPYKNGNNESCSDNRSGGYSIMVKGYTAFSNVSLTASYQ
ncbi:MAG: M12 family metallo-peptidase [Pseudoalteromonas prydzensis]|uniref:Pre-peptidase C-terminal domain-containing protein n=1 Tax=Pseudoalteromonas prydzensis TaxID=182141 RepID=A0ABR9FHP7_9GAMM|nr:M12 family metallo-peptidase [Pseudoalteromonas prydzensis]MBE0456349.1 pre-peptidase C-terminal domain-containing protein [Pseudoalteromonas prydzensis]